MASYNDEVVLNFKMNGQIQYAQTIKEINSVMNTAAKEYKNHIAAMGNDAAATDKLRAEKKKLEIQMEGAQKRTAMLSDEYEAMKNSTTATTEQLTKMYGKLLDAENAETKLQKSLDRVNEGLTDQAIEAREAQSTLNNLKDDSAKLEVEQRKLTSAFNLQNSELSENASEAEKVELAQKQLKQQISLTERTMNNLEQQLEATKKVYGENSTEVMQMETKLNDARATVNRFKKSLSDLEDGGEKAKKSMDGIGKATAAIGGAAPAAAIGGLVSSMEDYNATLARLNTNANQAGMSMDDVSEAFNEMQIASRDADSSVEGVSNLIAAGFDPSQILSATKSIAGAAIKWSETLNVEGLSDAVQETIAGGKSIGMFDELLSRSGVNIDKFNKGLQAASKSGKEQEYVLEQLTNLGLGSYLDKHKELNPEVTKQQEAQQKMTQALSDLSLILTPLVTDVAEFTTKLIEWANENPRLAEGIGIGAAAIGGLITVLTIAAPIVGAMGIAIGAISAPIAIAVGAIAGLVAIGIVLWKNWDTITEKASQLKDKVVKKATELKEGFVNKFTEMKDGAIKKVEELQKKASDTIKAFKENTIKKATELKDGFVNKVTELKDGAFNKFNDLKNKATSAIQSLKTNAINKASELKTSFVNKVNDLKNGAIEKFNSLRDSAGKVMTQAKEKILAPIELAKKTVKKIVGEIKDFFSGMKLKIPKPDMPKLPHFSLSTGSKTVMGKTITYPTGFDIDWRAKGAIFTQPTIFGQMGNRLQGAGDAGPEAALPLNADTLGAIGEGIAATMKGLGRNVDVTLKIDGRTLAKVQAPYIDQELGRKKKPWG